ncbi:LEAF RUST 10 DISEASE-RESISTANCE LOCUS RECEPTOR-LIKE PROTEIN KINASE-like 1.5 isoform X2 [Tasmannia lanceolata]|uniref:LEAF RUST 10 DISEASE-RESISTANCE LOCUS RECEPTOR-LIKE PROTEIN KINASE-like 1.5 isoform X2 n=1 Tax=Tasmannia lanceolata TaxID=3420 RepID=UPI004063177F
MPPLIFFFFFFFQSKASPPLLCPAFLSKPTFPFSTSRDCTHSCFQINCSTSPHSLIFIKNLSFFLLHQQPNSLTLSPSSITHKNISQKHPPIDLSQTPFHFSSATCSNLSLLCNLTNPQNPHLQGCPIPPNSNPVQTRCNSVDSVTEFLRSGIQVEWDQTHEPYFSNCKKCETDRNSVCGLNDSDPNHPFLCFRSHKPDRIALFITLLAIASLLIAGASSFAMFRYKKLKSKSNPTDENSNDPTAIFLHRYRSTHLLPPVFTYEELESSTNRFDSKRKIGDGGFGSVYLGQLHDGRIVAVKKLHCRHVAAATTTKSFCNEILILSSIQHQNLVKLHGYCSDQRGLLLVYDYFTNGTLGDHLHGSKSLYKKCSLAWQIRVEMALQIALAIEYLHFSVSPAVVHRDITTSNIFVEKDMKIKVGDFGLSRLLVFSDSSPSCVWTGPQGTPGYLDPDYHKSFRLTEKSDVYSFGVVLFELISGMKAVDLSRDKREVGLVDLVVGRIQLGALHQVLDPVLVLEGEAMGTVDSVAELGFRCVAVDKDDRPDAKEVVAELKRIRSRTRGTRSLSSTSDTDADIQLGS